MTEADEIAEIRARLHYDPATGRFTWLSSPGKRYVGKSAGCFDRITGYVRIAIAGKVRYAHRIAWAYVYGSWPEQQIDHINCDRTDNRITNLRQASASANSSNRMLYPNSFSGLKGAHFDKKRGKWRASIGHKNKTIQLGYFETKEAAHDAYVIAAERLKGEFARAA